jgi:hypothetical protein
VRSEALAWRLPFVEVPEGDKSRNFGHGLNAFLAQIARKKGGHQQEKDGKKTTHRKTHNISCARRA